MKSIKVLGTLACALWAGASLGPRDFRAGAGKGFGF